MPKNYNALFQADAVGFMRKYTCKPADDIAGVKGAMHFVNFTVADTNSNTYKYREVAPADGRGYLNFEKISQNVTPAQKMQAFMHHHGTGQISVTGQFAQAPNLVPAYFLPWQDNHIISLTIPPRRPLNPGLSYFFTAAINGCSVFIRGSRKNPTILHAGGSTGLESDPAAGAAFWRDMLQTHTATSGQYAAEVNKVDYTVDKVKAKVNTSPSGFKSKSYTKLGTQHSRKFEEWVKKEYAKEYLVESVAPTGCVMGIRDAADDWTFYLQENVTLIYYKFNKVKTGLFSSEKQRIDTSMNIVMRPLIFRQIFPGLGSVKYKPTMDRVLKD